MYIDKASYKGVRGVGVILKGLDGVIIKYVLRVAFNVTNNMVEYEKSTKGLDLVRKIKPKKLNVYNDSQLIVGQISD